MSRLRLRIFAFVLALCAALLTATVSLALRAEQAQERGLIRDQLEASASLLQRALQRMQGEQQAWIQWLAGQSSGGSEFDSPALLDDLRARMDVDSAALLDGALLPLLSSQSEPGLASPPWNRLSQRPSETRWLLTEDALWLVSQAQLDSAANSNQPPARLGLARRIDGRWMDRYMPAVSGLRLTWRLDDGENERRIPLPLAGSATAAAVGRDPLPVQHVQALHLDDLPLSVEMHWARPSAFDDLRLLAWQLSVVALLALVLAALGAVLIGNSITRPLNALVRHIRRISAGDLSSPAPVARDREVGAVAREFAFMLSSIAEREASIRRLAYEDGLTGLANRHTFQSRIDDLLGQGPEFRFVVLVADIDRFREINDTLGHAAGDRVLKQAALRLQNACRPEDLLARLSADEFGILLPAVAPTEVVSMMTRYRQPFRDPFALDGVTLDLSITLGAAVHPEHGEGAGLLLQRAEIALFQAKARHSGFALYTPEIDRHTLRRLTLMAELRAAIERNQLELYVQPKLDIRGWKIIGVECLVRWVHPDYGFVPPDEFIPLAEQTGTIRQVTSWIIRAALDRAAEWREAGYGLKVAVNLSTVDLLDPQLPQRVAAWLAERRLPAELLILEVTESAVMEDPERALPVLLQLRDHGIALSIDDFGTGYSSMAQLKRLPVEELKIDKSFVMDVANNPDDAVIVRATIDLAHNMELRVVAEGVENERTLEWLGKFGCDMAQGYWLSRPIPADQLPHWLASSPYLVEAGDGDVPDNGVG